MQLYIQYFIAPIDETFETGWADIEGVDLSLFTWGLTYKTEFIIDFLDYWMKLMKSLLETLTVLKGYRAVLETVIYILF